MAMPRLKIINILAGETLLVEDSFCTCLKEASLARRCTTCCTRSINPLPCPTCCLVSIISLLPILGLSSLSSSSHRAAFVSVDKGAFFFRGPIFFFFFFLFLPFIFSSISFSELSPVSCAYSLQPKSSDI